MSPEERNARSIGIRALLDDANVQAAFDAIEADMTEEWRRAQTTDERENMWRAVNTIERLKTWLHSNASHDLTALRRAK